MDIDMIVKKTNLDNIMSSKIPSFEWQQTSWDNLLKKNLIPRIEEKDIRK